MDSSPYISFIVSIYNVAAFLEDCVQSLCAIQNRNIEILLVNDGSTDESLTICRKFAERDSRVRILSQENRGLPASRNKGLKHAKGKWVCFVDGDDCLSRDFESRIISQMDDNVDVNCFGYQRMTDGAEPESIEGKNIYLMGGDLKEAWLRILNKDISRGSDRFPDTVLFEATWSKFIQKEKLQQQKIYFDENVSWGEDLLFNFKLMQRIGSMKVIDSTGYYYRVNALSMTQKYDPRAADRFRLLVRAMGGEVQKADSAEAAKQYQVFVLKQLLQSVQRDMLNPQNTRPYCRRRADYRMLRHGGEVTRALKSFPYRFVRPVYRLAIGVAATGNFGLLCFFYRIKQWKEGGG